MKLPATLKAISTLILAASIPMTASAALVDDFEDDTIDFSRWRTYSTDNATELVRDIDRANGRLVLHSSSDGTSGSPIGSARSHLIVNDSNPPQALEGTIRIHSIDPGPSDDGASISVEGYYYNADRAGAAGSGDLTGDVYAAVSIGDWGSGLEAWYTILKSTNADFTTWTLEDEGQITAPGSLSTGAANTLKVNYTGSNSFEFTVGSMTVSATGPSRAGDAALDYQQIAAYAADGSGPASVTGSVDEVFLNNAGVYDDFSSNRLDGSLWYESLDEGIYLEGQRNVENGKLRMDLGFDDLGNNRSPRQRLIVSDSENPEYFEAEVSLSERTNLDDNINGVAGISGYLYNEQYDGSSGYNGADGDVWGFVYLYEFNGVLGAGAYLESEHADFSTDQKYIANQLFMQPVEADQEYTLWMRREDDRIVLGIEDETITHTVDTPMHDPSPAALNGYRAVRTNLSGTRSSTSDAGGVVRATFDNVRTDAANGEDSGSGADSDSSGGGGGGASGLLGVLGLLTASLPGLRRRLLRR